jgi:hypothetical protein
MASNTKAHDAKLAGTLRVRLQIAERGARVIIVTGQLLADFVGVASIRACLIVWQDCAGLLEFVENLGHRNDKSVPRQHRSGSADGTRHLEYFRKQNQPRVPAFGYGSQNVCSHCARRGLEVDHFVVFDCHSNRE